MRKSTVLHGLILILLAIVLGAFGAHFLKNHLTISQLASFETGVRYQLTGGLFLLIIGLNQNKFSFNLNKILACFFIGICMFSISIYGLNLLSNYSIVKFLGPITPLGGLLMISSILLLIVKIVRAK